MFFSLDDLEDSSGQLLRFGVVYDDGSNYDGAVQFIEQIVWDRAGFVVQFGPDLTLRYALTGSRQKLDANCRQNSVAGPRPRCSQCPAHGAAGKCVNVQHATCKRRLLVRSYNEFLGIAGLKALALNKFIFE